MRQRYNIAKQRGNKDGKVMGKKVKLSIIIPTKDTLIYLKDNVSSIVDQDYDDYELIISDNHSEDGTYEWVQSLNNPHIKLIKPDTPLSMGEHCEWALNHANGDWIQILGSDDGVQPFYFQLAEFFIRKAEEKKLFIVNFPRAYFFWEGCQSIYNDAGVSFSAIAGYTIKKTKYALLSSLLTKNCYFLIPHLYVMSIIHNSVIRNVKSRMNGFFYHSGIPDAAGAACICSVEKKYLHSFIPLTWVGTSVRSMGVHNSTKSIDRGRKELFSRRLIWHPQLGGSFESLTINEIHLYFYEAILQYKPLQSFLWKKIYYSKWFKTLVFSNVFVSIENSQQKIGCLKSILAINKISFSNVVFCRYHILPYVWKIDRVISKIKRIQDIKKFTQKMECHLPRFPEDKLSLMDAYRIIKELDKESNFISNFLKKG